MMIPLKIFTIVRSRRFLEQYINIAVKFKFITIYIYMFNMEHVNKNFRSTHIKKIPIKKIVDIPWLPERENLGDLVPLVKTIQRKGDVDIPIKVRKTYEGNYERIWGKRRLIAAKLAGIDKVTCIVEEVRDDEEVYRQHAVENIHRLNKNPIEEAEFFKSWASRFNRTYDEIANMLGINKKYIYNRVELLKLPESIKNRIKNSGTSNFGVYHGLLLLKVKDPSLQEKLAIEVIEKSLSVRELNKLIEEVTLFKTRKEYRHRTFKPHSDAEYFDLTQPLYQDLRHTHLLPAVKVDRTSGKVVGLQELQKVQIPPHTGTHVDTPDQFLNNGKTIECYKLDKFIGRGMIIDVPKNGSEPITLNDLERYEDLVVQGDIVFFYTGWASKYGTKDYMNYPYLTDEVACWLIEKKVSIVGFDTFSPETICKDGESYPEYPIHKMLLEKDILIIENLADMNMIAGKIVYIYAIPLKVLGAKTTLVNVIATINKPTKDNIY